MVIIITGAHKALALKKCIEDGVNHMWTLSSLQMHPHAMIVVDEDATLELQVKTVKYFKSIEQVATSQGIDDSDLEVFATFCDNYNGGTLYSSPTLARLRTMNGTDASRTKE